MDVWEAVTELSDAIFLLTQETPKQKDRVTSLNTSLKPLSVLCSEQELRCGSEETFWGPERNLSNPRTEWTFILLNGKWNFQRHLMDWQNFKWKPCVFRNALTCDHSLQRKIKLKWGEEKCSLWKAQMQSKEPSRTWEAHWPIKYHVKISNFLVVNYLFSSYIPSIYFTSLIPKL